MAYRMALPDIGEGVVEAEVQRWLVAPGDAVAEDQPLVEVMTDKATVTIPSPRRGRVVRLFWKEGEIAKVHEPLVEIEVDAPEASASAAPPAPAAAAPGGPSAARGLAAAKVEGAPGQRALAAPAVRALARELGIDVNALRGTGPGGRVTKEDVRGQREATNGHRLDAATATPASSPTAGTVAHEAVPPEPFDSGASGASAQGRLRADADAAARSRRAPTPPPADERIPLRGVRRRIAENMARSKRTAAHFTFVEQADVSELVRVKDRIAEAAWSEGVKVTFLPFVVKAVVAALRKHPRLNATMDEERGELVLHRRFDLGIASATEAGLVVPVLRGADQRSLLDVAREIDRLAGDAKAGRLRPEDVGRSTFTLTSLGALGGLFATPVLNHPEVGILGLHRIRPTPIVKDGAIVVRDVMHVSVTSDHRVVDGHEAAAFAYAVIRTLEDPDLLLMQMS